MGMYDSDEFTNYSQEQHIKIEQICKNCKWWNQWRNEKDRGECNHGNSLFHVYTPFNLKDGKKPYVVLAPYEWFGCNNWKNRK